MPLADVIAVSDALSIGMVVTLIGSIVGVMRTMQARDQADATRHHKLDLRLTLLERQMAERDKCSRSGVYDTHQIRDRTRDD